MVESTMEDFIRHAKEFGFCAGSGNALMGFMWGKYVIRFMF